jgi:hypothetical protein
VPVSAAGQDANPSPITLELVRLAVVSDGAFGILKLNGLPWLATLERTYPVAGCVLQGVKIPSGVWRCERTRFERGGYDTFEITGIEGHSRLLFHVLNVETESEGCIGLGLSFGWLGGHWAILDSRAGFADFMRRLDGVQEFVLTVRNDVAADARCV